MESPPDPAPSPGALVSAAVVFYGLMTLAGLVVMALADLDPLVRVFGADLGDGAPSANAAGQGMAMPLAGLLGVGAGLAVVLLTWLLRNVEVMKRLRSEFEGVLGQQGSGAIALLAVTSAIGEEVLFRGALHPLLGFWPTAILFGLLHGGHNPRLWPWAVFALLAGILLAWLTEATGNLLAPILAHLTVNYWNLHALVAPASADEVA